MNVTFVHSKMSDKERDKRVEGFTRGDYHVMANNGILTTGFDYPALDFIGMMKLTQRSSLWGQMIGRLTRPFYADGFDLTTREGRLNAIAASHKLNGLVLDFAKNSERLGPINDPVVKIPGERKRPGEAPIRVCDNCGSYNHASAPQCKVCDFVFPRREKFNDQTSGKALVKKVK
ncbi:helicase-related protein, partial [Staphylococcus aureus]|uniref:helicase-related protein n=1 Tax=Staphylococcus aureus TaxID=1280 RepID=UPI0034A0CEEF